MVMIAVRPPRVVADARQQQRNVARRNNQRSVKTRRYKNCEAAFKAIQRFAKQGRNMNAPHSRGWTRDPNGWDFDGLHFQVDYHARTIGSPDNEYSFRGYVFDSKGNARRFTKVFHGVLNIDVFRRVIHMPWPAGGPNNDMFAAARAALAMEAIKVQTAHLHGTTMDEMRFHGHMH